MNIFYVFPNKQITNIIAYILTLGCKILVSIETSMVIKKSITISKYLCTLTKLFPSSFDVHSIPVNNRGSQKNVEFLHSVSA